MFTLPALEYGCDDLAPTISEEIMRLHHTKHHQTYVDKLNAALHDVPDLRAKPIVELLSAIDVLPESVRSAVRNHGGGHYNHSLFWQWLSPSGGGEPSGELYRAIVAKFGTYQGFVDEFTSQSLSIFGSGWVWLMPDMAIITTPNQDTPIMAGLSTPLLGLDVWEHAYYLDYRNQRDRYVAAWWDVVNWQRVEDLYRSFTETYR